MLSVTGDAIHIIHPGRRSDQNQQEFTFFRLFECASRVCLAGFPPHNADQTTPIERYLQRLGDIVHSKRKRRFSGPSAAFPWRRGAAWVFVLEALVLRKDARVRVFTHSLLKQVLPGGATGKKCPPPRWGGLIVMSCSGVTKVGGAKKRRFSGPFRSLPLAGWCMRLGVCVGALVLRKVPVRV